MPRTVTYVGYEFGELTVTAFAGSWREASDRKLVRHWTCDCSCGGTVVATTEELTSRRRWHCDNCTPEKPINYLDNYKEHLLTFSDEERQQLFAVLNGERGQRRVAEAVDLIMRARNSADAVKLVALILSGRRNAA